MGKIWNAVDRQVIRPRVYASEAEGIASTFESIGSFYGQGNPVLYLRTGNYASSPYSSGVQGGGGKYDYTIGLKVSDYNTGTYSGQKVFEEIQHNGSRILGKPGTWDEAQQSILDAVRKNFG